MADESKPAKLKRLSKNQKNIRNIATSAHIHHGKTALTDNLLAAAGFMSVEAAGDLDKGMATWQHIDEQTRLMTVDAANVSMAHTFGEEEYLINLIDTPGHVDFGGNVTRAMRAIDGTIVLVCASEGIMPQTETVIKQALRERVKPVLFINKVDRLITEMQYTPEKIQQRIMSLIIEFNRLVENIAEKEFKEKWKVNIQDGSVAFGSARENWALSLPFMQKKDISFKDILKSYELPPKEREEWNWKNAPLYEVLLDMVIKHLPTPLEAQTYRIPKIWRGDPESQLGKDMLSSNPNGKIAFCITRITIDQKSGREIAAGRLYSGTIKEGMNVYLNGLKQYQRVAQVLMYAGVKPEIVGDVGAGNVIALMGITGNAGETITDEPEQPFEELKHIFEPVITKAISPSKPQDLSKLVEVLKKVAKEDPSIKIQINDETGENLMSGMGELHLEIVENRIITEKGLQIKTSPPIIVYRETVSKKSPEMEGKTPNKHNRIYVTVEPLEPHVQELIKNRELPESRIKKKDMKIRDTLVDVGYDNDTALRIKDIYKGNIIIDTTKGIVQIGEVMELLLDGFEQVIDEGPLAREPCMGLKVTITDLKLHEDAIHRGPAQIYPAMRDAMKGAMMQAAPTLFEPMQVHLVEGPIDFTGELTKLIMNKRGQVLDMQQQGNLSIVKAKLPVGEMIGWSSDLRSATEGRGTSSLVDQSFEKMPMELQQKVINQIIKRKGLTAGQIGV
ncbi:elongation factor EF-2 [Candidatus Woesearchaeota archaeon]|nr:elongation factor EF-2 [Candidatus Woesearchaeota archaeon]